MKSGQKYFELLAGLCGFAGVVMGALAAHKAQDPYAEGLLRQASLYDLVHCAALLVLAARQEKAARMACFLFIIGILLFCGGLAVKALIGQTIIAKLVPAGGTCLMMGWLSVAALAFRKEN